MNKQEALFKKIYNSPFLCIVVENTIKTINENMFNDFNICYLFTDFNIAIKFKNKLNNGDLLLVEKGDYISLFSLFNKLNDTKLFFCNEINDKFQRLQINSLSFLSANNLLPINNIAFNCSRTINFQLINQDNEYELKKVISNIISNISKIETILNKKDFEFVFLVYHKFKTLLQKKKGENLEKTIKEILEIIQKTLFYKLFTLNKFYIPIKENNDYFYESNNEIVSVNVFLHQLDAQLYSYSNIKNYKIKTIKFYSFIDLLDEFKNKQVTKIKVNIQNEQIILPIHQNTYIDAFGSEINKTNIDLTYLNKVDLYNQKPIAIIFNGKPEINGKIHLFFTKKSYDLWIKRYKLNGSAVIDTVHFEKVINYLKNNNSDGICMFGLQIPNRRMHHIFISKKDINLLK